ncbi:MAG: GGDEF domain-containing protein [Clostridiales bacterium]|nr:GGDEF domain-containing protein [Clostridiales bacterium]
MSGYTLITIIEVLCINTYTTYKCLKRRRSKLFTFLSLCVVTIMVTSVLYPVISLLPGIDKGNGLFMLFGFLYIIPLYFLFDQPLKHLMIVMSSSWIYTMFAYSFSFRAASLYPTENLGLAVFIIQTILFILTLPYYNKLVNNIFVNILKNINAKTLDSLLAISLFWFIIIFLANLIFGGVNSRALEIIILFVIIVNSILTYKLCYKLVSVNIRAKELSQITKIDVLTQLKNRQGFYEDVHKKMNSNQDFAIVFIDLDNFKAVNDKLGHDAGDRYLLEFVKAVKERLGDDYGFYRLHGDEFICLADTRDVEAFCRELEKLRFSDNPHGLVFKGLSLGYSSFPADSDNLSKLLYLADLRMYQRKKEKHRM